MAHTNQTEHFHLPQYVGTDIINPLTDTNKAYEDIDTALYEQGQGIADANDDIDALKIQNGDNTLDTSAQTLSGAINELKSGADSLATRTTTNETDISTLQTQMSTATGNITTLNTSVAGLQTEVASKASATDLSNLATKVGTGALDTVAQNCVDAINEVKSAIPSGASNITYDNTDSGLTATNVQSAIDELASDTVSADEVTYDNTTSGLTATNVQNAIDEVAQNAGKKTLRATSTSGGTWASQLTELETVFSTLTAEEKAGAYIVRTSNSGVFRPVSTSGASMITLGADTTGILGISINLNAKTALSFTGNSGTDVSSTALASSLELYA